MHVSSAASILLMTDDQDDDDRKGCYDDVSLSIFCIKHIKLESFLDKLILNDVDYSYYSDVTMSVMAFQITCVLSLLIRLYRCRSKKISKLRATGICEGNLPVTGGFPPKKRPVTRKMFPFDDVIMYDDHQVSKRDSFCWIGTLSIIMLLTTLLWIITTMRHSVDDFSIYVI